MLRYSVSHVLDVNEYRKYHPSGDLTENPTYPQPKLEIQSLQKSQAVNGDKPASPHYNRTKCFYFSSFSSINISIAL